MSVSTVTKEQFKSFVAALIDSDQQVVGVQAKGDRFAFSDLTDAEALCLDYDVTILPPKKYVLPQKEALLNFEVGGACETVKKCEKTVLIGVHPYDMVAINQMDELFRQGEYDAHYMTRRENLTIIACDVVKASENVFASSMNTATCNKGYDILLTDIGDEYVVDAATEKGQAMVKMMDGAVDAGEAQLNKRKDVWERNNTALD